MIATSTATGAAAPAPESAGHVPLGGRRAWRVVARGRGRVRAVFARSVYLENGSGLCCIGPRPLPAGPLNLVLPASWASWSAFRLRLHPGDPWQREGETLLAGAAASIPLPPGRTWRAGPAGARRGASDAPARLLRLAAAGAALRGGVDRTAVCTGAVLAHGCAALAAWLRGAAHGCPPVPDAAVPGLVGRGSGLTPEGDDVLVGVLVALAEIGLDEFRSTLASAIHAALPGRTGAISAAHLQAACDDGEAVAPVHAVARALAGHGEPDRAVRELLEHGQTSGAAALRGIGLVAAAMSDRAASTDLPPGTELHGSPHARDSAAVVASCPTE